MTTARLTDLIAGPDNFELVRDQIAGILKAESAAQQALATAAGEDPRLWALRVFTERSDPFAVWFDTPDQIDAVPIVNIRHDNGAIDRGASNPVSRQKYRETYTIECFGYGVNTETDAGHQPADEAARLEAQRVGRLVRRILMASTYTYLRLGGGKTGGPVAGREIANRKTLDVSINERPTEPVAAHQLELRVDLYEDAPQVTGQPWTFLAIAIKRAETGEVVLAQAYDASE